LARGPKRGALKRESPREMKKSDLLFVREESNNKRKKGYWKERCKNQGGALSVPAGRQFTRAKEGNVPTVGGTQEEKKETHLRKERNPLKRKKERGTEW